MQKIKLKIANRVYPLTTQPEQEEGLRTASKKIDIMIKHFEDKYAVKDKQDALAMCALQLATQSEQENVSEAKINEEVGNRLEYLNKSIQEVIDL
ncbi:MAG: cell division protein ZapA [Flavobacteriaceae bacterium]|jgi:cell division protein ZapA|nr:cell division protein ZapA [Flavobacteriaceae bacterium]|tara:strand:- start:298 stop:582 length:285 start_codon:yes stop_codon:yes gene_type:complete